MTEKTDPLGGAHPILKVVFSLIKEEYEKRFSTYTLVVTESYRSPERQQKLYAQGRTQPGPIVTNIDGVKKLGNHNYFPSRAIDVAVVSKTDGRIKWGNELYNCLGEILEFVRTRSGDPQCKQVGWGGWWKSFKDLPHFELIAKPA